MFGNDALDEFYNIPPIIGKEAVDLSVHLEPEVG
jgi:hypothetical protein